MKRMVILNPTARQGRALGLKDLLIELLGFGASQLDLEVTEDRGHATLLATQALEAGYDHLIAVGGDGTANEVANGFFMDPQQSYPQARLSVILQGTGCDLGRSFGLGPSLEEQIARIHWGRDWPIDVIQVTFKDPEGVEQTRVALNVTGFGLSGAVDRRMQQRDRESAKASGRMAFFGVTAQAYLEYQKPWVRLSLDGGPPISMRALSVAVANGQFFGGGMWIAPQARNNDGYLEVVVLGDLNPLEVVTKFAHIYRGTHLGMPNVYHYRAQSLEAQCDPTSWIDLDGEAPGQLPAKFEVLPLALTLRI
ncbi:MAG: diacylglycerol kinase family lipid kinase [bacterium]|nr:diacylglycerol kinase family lipid kinase [bacterium]